jgi:hypothetical protein
MVRRDRDDMPEPYRLSNVPPTRPHYVRMKGFRASSERESDEFDKPALKRFLGSDPFPWALALCVLVWIGLGLATRAEPQFGLALIGSGLLICLLAQVWIYVSLAQEDPVGAAISVFSSWYRTFMMYTYADVIWKPMLLTLIGVLMVFTGAGMFWTRAMHW